MKKYTLSFLLILINSSIFSQQSIQWQKCLGGTNAEIARSIQQTLDGGYIVSGYTASNNGDVSGNHGATDFWVVKLDAKGNLQWQKCLGGTNFDDATSIQQTLDGGYIVSGYTNSNNGDVSGNHGSTDFWVVKLDTIGNLQWQKCLGGTNSDEATSIKQTSNGGFIIAGQTISNDGDVSGNHGGSDFWFIKLNSLGVIQWQKCLGGTHSDNARSTQQTSDGGFIVVGATFSNDGDVSGHHGNWDFWVVKLDTTGNLQWQKCLGGTDADNATSIQQTTDGGYIVSGYTASNDGDVSGNQGNHDFWELKLDAIGNLQWQKCLGGTDADYAYSIQQTLDGGYILSGYTPSNNGDVTGNHGGVDTWVVKLSSISTGMYDDHSINQRATVYPNPASDNLVIDCGTNYTGLNGYSIRITNLLGQTVYNSPVTAQITNIQLSPPTWVNGTYVVQFVHPNGTVVDTKRIIIQ
jgi:hypothetical protein